MKRNVVMACTAALLAHITFAQSVTKCTDKDGKTSYSDTECFGQKKLIRVDANTIGDGGAEIAKKSLVVETKNSHLDAALRKYRNVTDRISSLRSTLDNNEASKQAEMNQIMEDQRKCRQAGNFSRRCHDLDALRQSDIDAKYHTIWMTTHSAWSNALDEKLRAAKELIAMGGKLPD